MALKPLFGFLAITLCFSAVFASYELQSNFAPTNVAATQFESKRTHITFSALGECLHFHIYNNADRFGFLSASPSLVAGKLYNYYYFAYLNPNRKYSFSVACVGTGHVELGKSAPVEVQTVAPTAVMAADNNAIVWINNQRLNWAQVGATSTVLDQTLTLGVPYIAVNPPSFTTSMQVSARVSNVGGGAYLSGCFYVGKSAFVTDSRWKCKYFATSAEADTFISSNPNWAASGFDDSTWTACYEKGAASRLPCSGVASIWPSSAAPASNSVGLFRRNFGASAPANPENVRLAGGLKSVTATFDPSLNGFLSLSTTYILTCSSNTGSVSEVTGSDSPLTISGLTNVPYNCSVTAKNTLGSSDAILTYPRSVTPAIDPLPPTNVAVAYNEVNKVQISFTASSNLGGSRLKRYKLTVVPTSTTVATPAPFYASSSPVTISSLKTGTSYTITMQTETLLGTSVASSSITFTTAAPLSSTPGTKCTAPTAATGSVIVSGNGQITITVNPSTTVTGSCVGKHQIIATPAANSGVTAVSRTITQNVQNSASVTYSSVKAGIVYTITVVTSNSVGSVAGTIGTVTPLNVPGAVSGITVLPDANQISITGFTVGSNGGSTITSYEVLCYNYDKTLAKSVTITAVPTTTAPAVITGLTNNARYYVTVAAINQRGMSRAVGSNSFIVGPRCTVPTPVATAGITRVTVTWSEPTDCSPRSYEVYCATCPHTPLVTSGRSVTFTTLTNNQVYNFNMRVNSTSGLPSALSTSVSATPKPDFTIKVPTWTYSSVGSISVSYTFSSSSTATSAGITGVKVFARLTGTTTETQCATGAATATSGLICSGLTDNKSYRIRVEVTNGVVTRNGYIDNVVPGCSFSSTSLPPAPTITASNSLDSYTSVTLTTTSVCSLLSYTVTAKPTTGTSIIQTGSSSPIQITRLTNGMAYTISATASYNSLVSSISNSVSITPAASTVARSVVITTGNQKADLVWTSPSLAITSWKLDVFVSPITSTSVAVATRSVTTASASFTGLTNGVTYIVRFSTASVTTTTTSPTFVPATTPSAPTVDSVTALDVSAVVTFSVSNNGGATISLYTITATPATGTAVTFKVTSSPATLTGLTNGVAYTVSVVATNSIGNSPASAASTSFTPNFRITPPTNIAANAGTSQATVSFTAVTNAASYTVYATTGSAATSISATGTSSPITVTGLTNGVEYQFYVVASNSAFNSDRSESSAIIICGTVPGSPTGVIATAGNAVATVKWTAPTSNGFSAITSYTITSSPDGKSAVAGPTETSIDISGLTNGVSYSFAVVATNRFGDSTPSNSSSPVIPVTAPSAPTDPTATYGNGRITCSFNAPSSNGGLAIASYTIALSNGRTITNVPGSPYTITGLTNGQGVTFNVTAYNGVHYSPVSANSDTIVPSTVPDAPTAVVAVGKQDKQSEVSWTAPASDGGASILYYNLQCNDGQQINTTSTKVNVTGLLNGNAYDFTVQAVNLNGASALSVASIPITPASVPSSPSNLMVTSGLNGRVQVAWDAPFNQGDAITTYTIITSDGVFTSTVADAVPADGSQARSGIVTGLQNGQSYKFKVRARNSLGDSAWSDESAVAIPVGSPSVPTNVTATSLENKQSLVAFIAPSFNGGSSITAFTVRTSPDDIKVTGSSSPIRVTGLKNGEKYTFTVTATNENNYESGGSAGAEATPAGAPEAPIITAVVSSLDKKVTITFTPPVINGGAELVSYVVAVDGDLTKQVTGTFTSTTSRLPTTATITGLNNGQSYKFVARVTNAAVGSNTSPWSELSAAAIPAGPSQSPSNIQATASENGKSTISFTAPQDNGGAAISSYTVTSSPDGKTATGAASPLTVTGLTNGRSYTFTVTATNAVGHVSSPSVASASIIPAGPPTVPTSVAATVTSASGTVSIAFAAPQDNGGSSVATYTVTSKPDGKSITSASSPIVISGLSNGVSYTFDVLVTNVAGYSSPVTTSSAVIPVGPPDAPTGIAATKDEDAKSTVSFVVPTFNGGAALTSYTVTSIPGGLTATGSSSPIVVTGLTNGVSYTFNVTVANAGGHTSSGAISTTAIIPVGAPSTVTQVSATSNENRKSQVSFVAPAFNGGANIVSYTVTANPGGISAVGVSSPILVSGLTNGQAYTFTVVATNLAKYASASSAAATATPATVPDAVTGVTATSLEDKQTIVRFTPPTNNGGAAITGFKLIVLPSNIAVETTSTYVELTGLTNGVDHSVTVRACNAAGCSAESGSNTFKPATIPGAPTDVAGTSYENGQTKVTFKAPNNNGGDAITTYIVTALSADSQTITAEGTSSPVVVTGLTNGIYYTLTVVAKNNAKTKNGMSSPSLPSAAVLPYNQPAQIKDVTSLTSGPDTCLIRWSPVSLHTAVTSAVLKISVSDGSSAATVYEIPQKFADATTASPVQNLYLLTGLDEQKPYTVSIVSQVNFGTISFASDPSASVTCTAGANVAPVVVYWTRETEADAPTTEEIVLSYEWPGSRTDVDCHLHNGTVSSNPLQKSPSPNFLLRQQNPSNYYHFIVTCQNNKGLAPASTPLILKPAQPLAPSFSLTGRRVTSPYTYTDYTVTIPAKTNYVSYEVQYKGQSISTIAAATNADTKVSFTIAGTELFRCFGVIGVTSAGNRVLSNSPVCFSEVENPYNVQFETSSTVLRKFFHEAAKKRKANRVHKSISLKA